jgi:PTS system ascorbate-specific IIA component
MPLPPVPDTAITLGASASDWQAAIGLVGAALTASGATTAEYSHEMIRMIEEHGPYIVIAPGLAFAHARPGPAVLHDGLAVATLTTPVAFGNPYNDPVRVVLGLAVTSAAHHLSLVSEIANVFNDSDAIARLAAAASPDEVRGILGASA